MNQKEKNQALDLAEHYFYSDNYLYAESILKKILEIDPLNSKANELLAYIYGNNGDFDTSLELLEVAAKDKNCRPEALYYLGSLQLKKQAYLEAITNLKKSVSKGGLFFEALNDIGSAYAFLGKFELALSYYQKCLPLKENSYELHSNIGGMLDNLERFEEAITQYNIAIQINPNFPDAWINKGSSLNSLGRHDEALEVCDHAIKIDPSYSKAWASKGMVLIFLKRHEEAIIHYDKAIELNPNYPEAWANKGNALGNLKHYDEAIKHFDRAIQLKSDYPEAWVNKGVILSALKRHNEALAIYDHAIEINPKYANAWSCKGMTLTHLKRFGEAIINYNQATKLKPNLTEAWASKSDIYHGQKRYDEALNQLEQAIQTKQQNRYLFGQALHLKMKMCDWSFFDDSIEYCILKIREKEKVIAPFPLLSLIDNPSLHKECAEIFSKDLHPQINNLDTFEKLDQSQKIRIGYFSSDFRNHPVAYLTAELFELHNKSKFEILAFSFSSQENSQIQARLINSFSDFINVSEMSDLEIANLARSLKLDIAIDLGGFTLNSPLPVFAFKIAPIQISYIGYLGTLATNYIDYVIGDNVVIPKESEKFFSEKIIRLPCFQVNDRKKEISDKKFSRQELGIPDEAFVFCCFNNNYKITPIIFNSWMNILKSVEGSVLFLYAENKWAEENLKKEAELRGVNQDRIIFGQALPRDEYLSRYQACDIFLDTFPYNAGTTASDALWMGLPVLTYSGKSFASRMARSLLESIGLSKLVTYSLKDYEKLAITLAKNSDELSSIREELSQNKMTYPLFNTELFTKNIEKAYETVYANYLSGKPTENIDIKSVKNFGFN